jgi:FixJ family two-component response regulator
MPLKPTDAPLVCIVDDDRSLLRALRTLLTASGFKVRVFASGEAFLQSAQGGRFHCAVIIVDVHLITMSGFDVHDRLKDSGLLVPTIFITGRDDRIIRAHAHRAGAVAYLTKPFEPHALIAAIQQAVAKGPKA